MILTLFFEHEKSLKLQFKVFAAEKMVTFPNHKRFRIECVADTALANKAIYPMTTH